MRICKMRNIYFPRTISLIFIIVSVSSMAYASKVAIVQYRVEDLHEIGVDADRIETLIREAAGKGAELIVTPETSFYRYEPWEQNGVSMLDLANHYEELTARFALLARELGVSVVIGLREPSGDKGQAVYNTAVFIGPDGSILGKQRKIFPSNSEKEWTKAGTSHQVFETDFGRVGMMICKTAKTNWWNSYDSRDDLDLFILIAGDQDATSFEYFPHICLKSNSYGLIANQITYEEGQIGKGNSSWGFPDGSFISLGGDEKIFYRELPLPIKDEFSPQHGQIMVDPENPSWLVYNRDNDKDGRPDPYFMVGPGDPEGFLYRGKRNPDGTRDGDQLHLVNEVAANGGNCMYLMAVRTHGGDAWKDAQTDPENYPDVKHNPWIGQQASYGLNPQILDQWEIWFTEMDRKGITIYFFIYDDAIRVGEQVGWHLDEEAELHPGEQRFIEGLVNRFEHHKNLIWCIMEEGQEIGREWQQHVSKIAEHIRRTDDFKHVIASHQLSGSTFFHAEDPHIDQFAIQAALWECGYTPDSMHQWLVDMWKTSSGKYSLNMSEYKHHETLLDQGDYEEFRKMNWAISMAGSYLMAFGMDIEKHKEALQDYRSIQHFFESTEVNQMSPHDELKFAGTQYVLAAPAYSYIAYSSIDPKHLGLGEMEEGLYDQRWFDCISGQIVERKDLRVKAGDQKWKKPKGFGPEIALYLCRTDVQASEKETKIQEQNKDDARAKEAQAEVPNIRPLAPDQIIHITSGTSVELQLSYEDPDGGPGPYQSEILIHPSYGKLLGVGNDQIYTPVTGYKGEDEISWKVNDGKDDSKIARIKFIVE